MLATHVEVVLIVAPLATNKFKRSEPQVCRLFEAGQEHAHEADCREVLNVTLFLLIVEQRNGELIPSCLLHLTIAGVHIGNLLVGNIVHAHFQGVGMNGYTILEVTLVLVQCIVLVDILDIGSGT